MADRTPPMGTCARRWSLPIAHFIETLPEGVATIVGDRGVKLSPRPAPAHRHRPGVPQDAPILLLDEATSALDSEFEETVREAFDRLMGSRTVIAIAHRLSSLRNFDRIVVMQAGAVCEDGPPQVLVQRKGVYSIRPTGSGAAGETGGVALSRSLGLQVATEFEDGGRGPCRVPPVSAPAARKAATPRATRRVAKTLGFSALCALTSPPPADTYRPLFGRR